MIAMVKTVVQMKYSCITISEIGKHVKCENVMVIYVYMYIYICIHMYITLFKTFGYSDKFLNSQEYVRIEW